MPATFLRPPDPARPAGAFAVGLRTARVAAVLAWYGARAALVLGLMWLARRPRAQRWDAAGRRLARALEALGPTFVKIGQLLSTRADLLPPDLLVPLRRLRDDVRPGRPWRSFRAVIESSTGGRIDAVFSEFDATPVATASIAHVYRARLRATGQPVAVKVRRPGLERTIAADARVMRAAAGLLERLPGLSGLPARAAVAEVLTALAQQLDFLQEAEHNRRFSRLFADTPSLRIPRLVDWLCGPEVIVMEFFGGLRRLDDPDISDRDFARSTSLLLHAVYRMIFTAGVVHCDLHPSNVCLHPDGDLVVLDTGFVACLGDADRRRFATFFVGVVFDDADTCCRILLETATGAPADFDADGFRGDVRRLIADHSGLKAGEFQVVRLVGGLFELQRRHGLRGSTAFTMAILSLLVVEGVVRHRLRDLDFQGAAVPYVSTAALASVAGPVQHRATHEPDRHFGVGRS